MSEQVHESYAIEFINQHVYAPNDYTAYAQEVMSAWKKDAGRSKGFWLRANGDTPNEFGALINYLQPTRDGLGLLGAIDISSEGGDIELQVLLPSSDGSRVPIVASKEPYGVDALERAIDLVEIYTA